MDLGVDDACRPELGLLTLSPPCLPQTGQAPMPCPSRTRSATAICCSRDACCGVPLPPNAFQVDAVNCRPPKKPLPVFAAQLPEDSHWAIASQFTDRPTVRPGRQEP